LPRYLDQFAHKGAGIRSFLNADSEKGKVKLFRSR
jgi:hypothetical protein